MSDFYIETVFVEQKHFNLEYIYQSKYKGITNTIIEMAINGSGIRDTSRKQLRRFREYFANPIQKLQRICCLKI